MFRPGHIELFVSDPARSQRFYTDILGFELVAVQHEGQFVWVKLGETELLLRPGVEREPTQDYQRAASGLVLYSDDVEADARRLRERGLTFAGTDGSDHCLTFTDPDGHWFQLVNPHHE